MLYRVTDNLLWNGGSLEKGVIIDDADAKKLFPGFDFKGHLKRGTFVPVPKSEEATPTDKRAIGSITGNVMPSAENPNPAPARPGTNPAAISPAAGVVNPRSGATSGEDGLDDMNRQALMAMAEEEGVTFAPNIGDATLREKIRTKRAEGAENPDTAEGGDTEE